MARPSLNVKGAYLEVVADTVGSVGVIVAGILVARTGSPWWDTIVALAIAVFVAVRAIMLGREVLAVLGQHAPAGVDPEAIDAQLRAVPGVLQVHDLHLWTLTSGMNVATAHLVAEPNTDANTVLTAARKVLRGHAQIEHATLQIESGPQPADAPKCLGRSSTRIPSRHQCRSANEAAAHRGGLLASMNGNAPWLRPDPSLTTRPLLRRALHLTGLRTAARAQTRDLAQKHGQRRARARSAAFRAAGSSG